jgi:hypothetical protein
VLMAYKDQITGLLLQDRLTTSQLADLLRAIVMSEEIIRDDEFDADCWECIGVEEDNT